MFTGLASPSHLIILLMIILLLFGTKRIPELAKGLGTGIKEFRRGVSAGDATPEMTRGEETSVDARVHGQVGNENARTDARRSL